MKLSLPATAIHKIGLQVFRRNYKENKHTMMRFEQAYNDVVARRKSHSPIEVYTGFEVRRTSLPAMEDAIRRFKEQGGAVKAAATYNYKLTVLFNGVSFVASPRLVKKLVEELNELHVMFTLSIEVSHA